MVFNTAQIYIKILDMQEICKIGVKSDWRSGFSGGVSGVLFMKKMGEGEFTRLVNMLAVGGDGGFVSLSILPFFGFYGLAVWKIDIFILHL